MLFDHGQLGLVYVSLSGIQTLEQLQGFEVVDDVYRVVGECLEQARGDLIRDEDFVSVSSLGDAFLIVLSPSRDSGFVAEEDLQEERPIGEVGLFDLIDAFNEVLARAKIEPIGEIEPIRWTVPDKIDMILEMTSATARIRFSKLFNPDSPRGEVIVTFLALLELLRLRQITILQESPFTEIEIAKIGPAEADHLPPPVIGGKDHAEPL